MKKLLFITVIAILSSCEKEETLEDINRNCPCTTFVSQQNMTYKMKLCQFKDPQDFIENATEKEISLELPFNRCD